MGHRAGVSCIVGFWLAGVNFMPLCLRFFCPTAGSAGFGLFDSTEVRVALSKKMEDNPSPPHEKKHNTRM